MLFLFFTLCTPQRCLYVSNIVKSMSLLALKCKYFGIKNELTSSRVSCCTSVVRCSNSEKERAGDCMISRFHSWSLRQSTMASLVQPSRHSLRFVNKLLITHMVGARLQNSLFFEINGRYVSYRYLFDFFFVPRNGAF